VETSNLRFKQGDIRSDGMVFWQYCHTGKERWVYPEKYQEIRQRRIEKCKKRWQEKYKEKYKEKCKEYRKQNKEKLSLYYFQPLWKIENIKKGNKLPTQFCRHDT
jgi:hypothetical protein